MSPVKITALEHDTPIFQPTTLRDGKAADDIRALKPDLIAVVAYGKILPRDILEIPSLGCVNIHGSILPKYRGAAPIQWAVLNGEAGIRRHSHLYGARDGCRRYYQYEENKNQ